MDWGAIFSGIDKVFAILSNPVVVTVTGAVAAVAVKKWSRYRGFYSATVDVVRTVRAGRDPKSPGGKGYTDEELAAIGKEIVEMVQEGSIAFVKPAKS